MATTVSDQESFVDAVFGGEETPHSQDDAKNETGAGEETENVKGDGDEIPSDETSDDSIEDDGDDELEDDSSDGEVDGNKEDKPAAKAEEVDSAKLKQEVENLQKRLHDTQAAMHKATTERSALQKELDELKAKKENEDDWFSEDDTAREKELESSLKKADEDIARQQAEQDDLKKQEAVSVWDAAAAPVIKAHPDFENVMYEKFAPLLDPKTGNQQVIKEWGELKDKSPASAYEFAKKQLDIIEFQRDPAAYKANLLKAKQNNNNSEDEFDYDPDEPTGKDGLDMLNSENNGTESPPEWNGSFVDALFG